MSGPAASRARAATSLERSRRYRAEHAEGPESSRVWLFHAHVYFDELQPERVAEACAFRDQIAEAFALTAHLEVSSFCPTPVGPHPRGSFEILFTREVFADFVAWLMFTRPQSLDVLIHPRTRSQLLDHADRALWLGQPLELDPTPLRAADASSAVTGQGVPK